MNKLPSFQVPKAWKKLANQYKVFIIVFVVFVLLAPGALVVIDQPDDLVKILTNKATDAEAPMLISSLIQNLVSTGLGKEPSAAKTSVSGMGAVFVHAVLAGLIASVILRV